MKTISTKKELRLALSLAAERGENSGLVPTMGALHNGHLSLIKRAIEENSLAIVSIFVNPSQFNDKKDLENYPRDNDKDLSMLGELLRKNDIVFLPEVDEMYPGEESISYDFGKLDKVLEGAHRPGHFNGVAQIVSKLLELVQADNAYFGEKDLQQLLIIKKLVGQMDCRTNIIPCPIIREKDGLAMSSRNILLSPEEREQATAISRSLFEAAEMQDKLNPQGTRVQVIKKIERAKGLELEYFEIADGEDLNPVMNWEDAGNIFALIAVRLGKVRLIDNIRLK